MDSSSLESPFVIPSHSSIVIARTASVSFIRLVASPNIEMIAKHRTDHHSAGIVDPNLVVLGNPNQTREIRTPKTTAQRRSAAPASEGS